MFVKHIDSTAPLLTWQKSVLLLVLLITSCSAVSVYYVKPTTDTPCPGEPCHTLTEYAAQHHFKKFSENATMEFLPGNHTVEQTLEFSVTNLIQLRSYVSTQYNTPAGTVDTQHCPPGFQLSETQPTCICAERLQQYTNTCLVDDATVLRARDHNFWVGYDSDNGHGLILHPNCPFDYCISEEIYLAVNNSDKQCNYNRNGLLCGGCKESYSLALGSSRCLQCSNSYLTVLVALAFAGIVQVFLLLILRLTVAAGTIHGLIFYANIIAVNSGTFFKPPTTNVLTVFIAWLNLDLGIEICFYNGMDTYVKTWLQFAFPLYLWALVGMIIIGSYYSGKVARIFGNNPIAVLATVFLLSYAKLLRTVFSALSITFLEYPNNSNIAVWLFDGNIRYLSGKHIPLVITAVACVIFVFLPYSMVLVFGHRLQAKSGLKIFSWINNPKIKFILDAYHAPYTDKHRYWTGLLLLVRFCLCLFFTFISNRFENRSINLLAIAFATTLLLALPTILGARIYKTWYLGLLEISFILNLAFLTIITLYIHPSGGNQNAVTFTSVGVAFATFTGIVVYHSVQQIKDMPWVRKMVSKLSQSPKILGNTPEKMSGVDFDDSADRPVAAPTTTVIDLHELHLDMLREPCMETSQ